MQKVIVEPIRLKMVSVATRPLEVLMLGDGSGGDTIILAREFGTDLHLTYFDVPGSVTFECAMKRFARAAVNPQIITGYEQTPKKYFDALLFSGSVLSSCLTYVKRATGDIKLFLKPDGIALCCHRIIYNGVKPQFPNTSYI